MTPLTGGEEEKGKKVKKKATEEDEEEDEGKADEGEGEGEGEGEEEPEAEEEAVEEDEEGEEGGILEKPEAQPTDAQGPVPGKRVKKLLNAFNFCERAAMTYNNPFRVSLKTT